MEGDDILKLHVVSNVPLPAGALPSVQAPDADDLPF
jgi:hypothetical protein